MQDWSASEPCISAVWIDLGLKSVAKWEGVGTGVEMRNIQEAQQLADLFELLRGYQISKSRTGTDKGFWSRGP
jgi:hypothetical protein